MADKKKPTSFNEFLALNTSKRKKVASCRKRGRPASICFQEVQRQSVAKYIKCGLITEVQCEETNLDLTEIKRLALDTYSKDPTVTKVILLRSLQGPIINANESLPPLTSRTTLLLAFETFECIKVEPEFSAECIESPAQPVSCSPLDRTKVEVPKSCFKPKKKRKVAEFQDIIESGKTNPSAKYGDFSDIIITQYSVPYRSWDVIPQKVGSIAESPEVHGSGGYRDCFRALLALKDEQHDVVVKVYNDSGLERLDINSDGPIDLQTETKKLIQVNESVIELSSIYNERVGKAFVNYNKCSLGYYPCLGKYVFIEPFVPGDMWKAVQNTGLLEQASIQPPSEIMDICTSFAHFTLEYCKGNLIILDIQGIKTPNNEFVFIDPEICTTEELDPKEDLFACGNIRGDAIINFSKTHQCNSYCQALNLKKLSVS